MLVLDFRARPKLAFASLREPSRRKQSVINMEGHWPMRTQAQDCLEAAASTSTRSTWSPYVPLDSGAESTVQDTRDDSRRSLIESIERALPPLPPPPSSAASRPDQDNDTSRDHAIAASMQYREAMAAGLHASMRPQAHAPVYVPLSAIALHAASRSFFADPPSGGSAAMTPVHVHTGSSASASSSTAHGSAHTSALASAGTTTPAVQQASSQSHSSDKHVDVYEDEDDEMPPLVSRADYEDDDDNE